MAATHDKANAESISEAAVGKRPLASRLACSRSVPKAGDFYKNAEWLSFYFGDF